MTTNKPPLHLMSLVTDYLTDIDKWPMTPGHPTDCTCHDCKPDPLCFRCWLTSEVARLEREAEETWSHALQMKHTGEAGD